MTALSLREALQSSDTKPIVDSFSIQLTGWSALLSQPDALTQLEAQILSELKSPRRLLRWAVVKVEPTLPDQPFWCEGAYLRA